MSTPKTLLILNLGGSDLSDEQTKLSISALVNGQLNHGGYTHQLRTELPNLAAENSFKDNISFNRNCDVVAFGESCEMFTMVDAICVVGGTREDAYRVLPAPMALSIPPIWKMGTKEQVSESVGFPFAVVEGDDTQQIQFTAADLRENIEKNGAYIVTSEIRIEPNKAGYFKVSYQMADKDRPKDTWNMVQAMSHRGVNVGTEMAELIYNRLGIKDPLPRDESEGYLGKTGQYGKGRDGKWYGWSHRAIVGFGIGDMIFEENCPGTDSHTPFNKHGSIEIKSEDDAKEAAKAFAGHVS